MEVNTLKDSVGRLMRVCRLHRSITEKSFCRLGIHRSQFLLLMYLRNADGLPSQAEIAAHFEISAAAVAISLKKLEKRGLITRVPDNSDSRVNHIVISDSGAELMRKNELLFDENDRAMFRDVSEEERIVFDRVLEKIAENLIVCGAQDTAKPLPGVKS